MTKPFLIDQLIAKTVLIIVAHPDDETLWAGGLMLNHPSWKCFVVSLCRGSDTDRAPKFYNALNVLKAEGIMGDLDDGPEQKPLDEKVVEDVIIDLLPVKSCDLLITHSPGGEYTSHLRHEETGLAVIKLWKTGVISARELWTFAYDDRNRKHYPLPVENAPIYRKLTKHIWLRKFRIITETYGFEKDSWEAQTTPKSEAFWQISNKSDLKLRV
jgi:LmbE family N-acetylglucosaminyl deacetylase